MSLRSILIPFALATSAMASLAALPGDVAAQVRRCVAPDGRITYTDQRCRDIGAEAAPPRPAAGGAVIKGARLPRCPRNLQDLVYEVTSAIDRRDPNRLAALYHWTGMPNEAAYRVMGRLSTIVERPLVDVVAVMPATADGEDGNYYPQTTAGAAPIGLRLEQTLPNGSTPSRTFFALKRHVGCLWITF
ncbi:DUF4124 domain-containing protein [Lysobacter olei]